MPFRLSHLPYCILFNNYLFTGHLQISITCNIKKIQLECLVGMLVAKIISQMNH